jgi:hypothetical protein
MEDNSFPMKYRKRARQKQAKLPLVEPIPKRLVLGKSIISTPKVMRMPILPEVTRMMLSVDSLNLDYATDGGYQRELKKKHVAAIVRDFMIEAMGSLLVGQRSDGSYWLVDGQQRRGAAIALDITMLPCDVFISRGREHEAKIFHSVNKVRKAADGVDKYLSALAAKDQITMEIDRILKNHGFQVTKTDGWGNFRFSDPLYKCYESSTLIDVVATIRSAFEEDDIPKMKRIACQSVMVAMLDHVFRACSHSIDYDRLLYSLQGLTPKAWKDLVDRRSGMSGSRSPRIAQGFIEEIYNYRLKTKRITWPGTVL